MDELASWTAGATIGLHPMPGTCLNHILALPNKLFEYIQVPVRFSIFATGRDSTAKKLSWR